MCTKSSSVGLTVVLMIVATLANAQEQRDWPTITPGNVTVIDGDTLILDNQEIELHGIDALELDQTCKVIGKDEIWNCGEEAGRFLRQLVARGIICRIAPEGMSRVDTVEAVCFDGPFEINAEMVIRGYALADIAIGTGDDTAIRYSYYQDAAERAGSGIWNSRFSPPRFW